MEPECACSDEMLELPYSNVCTRSTTCYEDNEEKKKAYNCESQPQSTTLGARSHQVKVEVNSISTQTDSIEDSSDISSPCSSDSSSLLHAATSHLHSFSRVSLRKMSLRLLLFLVLISPCGQQVGAHMHDTSNAYYGSTGASTFCVKSTHFSNASNTALIPHPLFGGHDSEKDFVLFPLNEITMALQSRYSAPPSISSLEAANATETALMVHPYVGLSTSKGTALMVHPYVGLSTSKELTVVPLKPILSCEPAPMLPSSHLLDVIMLDRYIKNQDYRQCHVSEQERNSFSEPDLSEECQSPLQSAYSKAETVQAKYAISQANRGFCVTSDLLLALVLVLLFVVWTCAVRVSFSCKSDRPPHPTMNINDPLETRFVNKDRKETFTSNKPLSVATSRPKAPPTLTLSSSDHLESSPEADRNDSKASPERLSDDRKMCLTMHSLSDKNPSSGNIPSLEKDSQTGDYDSGFNSMKSYSQKSTIASDDYPTNHSLSDKNSLSGNLQSFHKDSQTGDYDSGINSMRSNTSALLSHTSTTSGYEQTPKAANLQHGGLEFPIGSLPSTNLLYDKLMEYDPEEIPDEDDLRDDMAHEAELLCLSQDQPMALDIQSLASKNSDGHSVTTESGADDSEKFKEDKLEERPQKSSQFSVAMPTNPDSVNSDYPDDSSISIITEQSLIIFQPSYFQHPSSYSPSSLPPDINVNLYPCEISVNYSETAFHSYPSAVQEAGIPLPANANDFDYDANASSLQQQAPASECSVLEEYPHQDAEEVLHDEAVIKEDNRRFGASIPEIGPCQPSLLSLDMPTTAFMNDRPADVIRGEEDSSDPASDDDKHVLESEPATVAPLHPAPVFYDNPPMPHQENEIRIKVEASPDIHGASVTVEPSHLQSFPAVALPPIARPLGALNLPGVPGLRPPLTLFIGCSPTAQDTGNPLPENSHETFPSPDQSEISGVESDTGDSEAFAGAENAVESEDEDSRRFGTSLSETGSCQPSLLSLDMPTIALVTDRPADVIRGEEDSSNPASNDEDQHFIESDPTTVATLNPAPVFYGNPPMPHQENEIRIKVEASPDIHGASVTVEPSHLQSFPAMAQPPIAMPPDHGASNIPGSPSLLSPLTLFIGQSPSVQNTVYPLPENSYNEVIFSSSQSVNSELESDTSYSAAFTGAEYAVESEDEDDGRLGASLVVEVEPCRPSLLSLDMPTTALVTDRPANVIRGEEDSSNPASDDEDQHFMETKPSTVATLYPAPVFYDNHPMPHQENEIRIKVEASPDIHGASVTVEPSHLQSFPAVAPPSRPPNINTIIRPFLLQYRIPLRPPLTMHNGYPPPVQEARNPQPTNSQRIGGANVSLPKLPNKSMLTAPNLHPRKYINNVVI